MAGYRVYAGDIDELVALILDGDGIDSVSVVASEVTPPGIIVQILGFTFDQGRGYTINARLRLVVPDQEPRAAMGALIELLNDLLRVIGAPSGPTRAVTVTLPDLPPLPGLDVPVDVPTQPYSQENP